MEGNSRRVIRQNTGDANLDGIHLQTRPVVCPFLHIHLDRVRFGHVDLPDPSKLLMPVLRWFRSKAEPAGRRTRHRDEMPAIQCHAVSRSEAEPDSELDLPRKVGLSVIPED